MYRNPGVISLQPMHHAERSLRSGHTHRAAQELKSAGLSWDDLTHARRSGSLGETIVQDQPPPLFRPDWNEGVVYIQGHKVAIVPSLLTALAVKVLLFSGKQVTKGAKRLAKRRSATA